LWLSIEAGRIDTSIVQLRDGRRCRGDTVEDIKIWNIFTGVCELTLSGHTDIMRVIVVIDELRICSCSRDKTIKVCDVSSGVCARSLEGHIDMVNDMVLLSDERICSITYDSCIMPWNVETGVCELSIRTPVNHNNTYRIVQLHDGRIIISGLIGLVVHILGD
jgi:WD40 repeat protein